MDHAQYTKSTSQSLCIALVSEYLICFACRMESQKNQAETQAQPESSPSSASFCQRSAKPDENAGVVANMRHRFSEFIHAPMDEHKACFKETYHKVLDSWNWNKDDKLERFGMKVKSIFVAKKEDE